MGVRKRQRAGALQDAGAKFGRPAVALRRFCWTKFLAGRTVEAMKPGVCNRKIAALTRIEVVAIIFVLAVLATLLLLTLIAARQKAQKITCTNYLCQVGLAFRIWDGDHTNLYPMSVSTSLGGTLECTKHGETFRHFQVMSNELSTPIILVFPMRHPAKDLDEFW